MIVSIIIFLFILSLLILIHEVGHFLAARSVGVRVEEFALGLPFTKRIWGRRIGGVEVSLYPILFGGFVRLTGEDVHTASAHDPGNFQNKSIPARALIIVAGVGMNILLGIILFTVVLGVKNWREDIVHLAPFSFVGAKTSIVRDVIVSDVINDTPAEAAGINPGERVVSINGEEIQSIDRMQALIHASLDQPTRFILKGIGGESRAVIVTPELDDELHRGVIGVRVGELRYYHLDYGGFPRAIVSGGLHAWNIIGYQVVVLKTLVARSIATGDGEIVRQSVTGPIGIGFLVHDLLGVAGKDFLLELTSLVALVSLSLGVINLLPLPALDGGRLPFLFIEGITGRRNPRIESLIHQAGMVVLLALVVLITMNDVQRFVDFSALTERWFPLP